MAEGNQIELIKSIRERTGAGMMDCKHALEECGWDIEKAIDLLREKGIAKQAKRAGRTASEGLTTIKVCDKCGAAVIVETNCETDFVAASDKFIAFSNTVAEKVLKNKPATIEEAKELVAGDLNDCAIACGEKLDFRRYAIFNKEAGQAYGTYSHMAGKIGVIVLLSKDDAEVSKPIAMHIAANAPLYIALENVPAADREREKNIALAEVHDDPKLANKPEQMLNQIVERKVDKVLSQSCLALQPFLLDDSKTVGQFLKEKGVEVISFVRYQVGEGIVKE